MDGRQAVQMVKDLKPQIVILDIAMPMLNEPDATRQILNENADQKVLILTMSDSEQRSICPQFLHTSQNPV